MHSLLRLTILIFLPFITLSCKKEVKVELPMEEEKIVAILGDMHFAKSASKIHKKEDRDSMRLVYENQVFVINDITRIEYENIITALETDLNRYYEIEKKVHKNLKDIQNVKK